jgi:uncharacterized protein
MPDTALTLTIQPETLVICRLAADTEIPGWATAGRFFSATRTADELSIVCPQECLPDGVQHSIQLNSGWRCLKVEGPLDFALTGILASLAVPLAQAGISIFAISTYDTDYLLVKDLDGAAAALTAQGHRIQRMP